MVESVSTSSIEWGTMLYSIPIFLFLIALLLLIPYAILKLSKSKKKAKEQELEMARLHQELKNVQNKLEELTEKTDQNNK
ncbi:hypothetical protein [Bacillus horti]|uniref:Sensor domain CHASE-containing protein n=1 Tax=Caldalkalibacillus horti TaxID=77523 RepID=A0ABT9W525_9BACI|nr:hypothetical protein [Bacillus horti]MDQ0168352.1 sensor domain CHASE-containing protein [Bacillus horti]